MIGSLIDQITFSLPPEELPLKTQDDHELLIQDDSLMGEEDQETVFMPEDFSPPADTEQASSWYQQTWDNASGYFWSTTHSASDICHNAYSELSSRLGGIFNCRAGSDKTLIEGDEKGLLDDLELNSTPSDDEISMQELPYY